MKTSNIYSSIQLSVDRWFDIYEVLCVQSDVSEGEKKTRLIFLRDCIREHIINLVQRDIQVEENV